MAKSLIWNKNEWHPLHYFAQGKAEGGATEVAILGGKGAHLAEMCNLGLPVPAGFTIDCDTSRRYGIQPKMTSMFLGYRIVKAYTAMAKAAGHAPLVSVRSGAPVSMPGMMDTLTNVGLTSTNLPFWRKRLGERCANDCRRRLIEEFGAIVYGIDKAKFKKATPKDPTKMNASELEALALAYETVVRQETGHHFPNDPQTQLMEAVEAVFKSWNNPRAIEYRRIEDIPSDMGTAVNVQTMVFGNAGDDSGSGVLFTRSPLTGEDAIFGDFLPNSQGEEVVAGTATPLDISEMDAAGFADQKTELFEIVTKLEIHYNDMQDIEFTIESGKLWMLQTRTGKRSALAAFRIAREMVDAGRWTKAEALKKVSPAQYAEMKKEIVDPSFTGEPSATAVPASPGFATGIVVTSNEEALIATVPVILVRYDTDPDDLPGMNVAVGIVTATGGKTSHAAVVARSLHTPCVTAVGVEIVKGIKAGMTLTLDGSTGRVWGGDEGPTTSGADNGDVKALIDWGYEVTGVMYQSARIEKPRQRVMVTEWLSDDDAKNSSLKALASMTAKARGQIILDVRGTLSFRRPEDLVLWEAFGAEPDKGDDSAVVAVIDLLEAGGYKGAIVTLEGSLKEHAARLEKAGYMVGREVETLADLMHSSGPVDVPAEFIEKVVGGTAVYAELIETFKKAGKEVTPMPASMTTEEVVAETFGS